MTALYKKNHPKSQTQQMTVAISKLELFVQELKNRTLSDDYESVEKEIHENFKAAEQEVLGDYLSRYDIDVPLLLIDGEVHKRVLRTHQEYITASGPIRVKRSLYRRKPGEKSLCPLELQAGIIEGNWTPSAARQALWVTSHLTPQEGEDLFKQLENMTPSKSSLDRLPKKIGERWEAKLQVYQEQLSKAETIPENAVSIAVSLDGVMIPMKRMRGEIIQTSKKKPKASNESIYKEASCGTVSFYDDDGDRLSTLQFARMPEHKKATLKQQLTCELTNIYEKRPELTLVKLADGAKDNWSYLEKTVPIGGSLLDFYHMSDHLKDVFDAAYGEDSSQCYAQFKKYQEILRSDYDGANKVIRAIEYLRGKYPKNKKIKETLTYFRNNRYRMAYAMALDNNLPIGSGVVEASCKTLVSQRLKRSGMRWAIKGGQAILSFRALIKSNRFAHAWDLLKETYRK